MKRKAAALTMLLMLAWGGIGIRQLSAASMKSQADNEINESKSLLRELERNNALQGFIPYRNYHDAKVYLDTAIYQFEEEREYEEAAFYAVLANIELETTLTIAKTRLARAQKLQLERNLYRDLSSKSSRWALQKIFLVEANVKKEGNSHRAVLFDYLLFNRNTVSVSPEGRTILSKIADLLKLYPWVNVKIIGHTRKDDPENANSLKKAQSIASALAELTRQRSRRFDVKGAGKAEPMDIRGKMKNIDRVEIIITGVR